jgi:Family of unknown function (DUF6088)
MKVAPKIRNSIEPKAKSIIHGHGRGWVFTPKDMARLGDPRSIAMALTRLSRKGVVRKLAHGLYDYPVKHPVLGTVAPSADAIARALVGRDAIRLQPAGAYALNLLGLSEQVPSKVVFLTDGRTRKVRVGAKEIILRHTTPRHMATAGRKSGIVIQALRHLGQKQTDQTVIGKLRRQITPADRKAIQKDLHLAPAWVSAVLREVSADKARP